MTKVVAKKEATLLRSAGHSYNYIASKVGVSKSTISDWLAKIPYNPNKETIDRIGKARARSGLVKHLQKMASIRRARCLARADISSMNKRDLFMLGLGLYIGEGTKTHGITRVINADPKIIQLAIRWFKEICGVGKKNFRMRIFLYPDNDVEECLNFWSKSSTIPRSQFQKTQIDLRKDKKRFKRGKLPYGTAHLAIRSNGKKEFGVFLARRINAWIEEVL